MDGLGDEHAAAVARHGAAPRLVVIGLRPPPGHGAGGGADGAEGTLVYQRLQPERRRAEAVLQRHAERQPDATHAGDDGLGAVEADVQRLLEQHVLAPLRRRLDQFEMGVRRGEDPHGVDVAARQQTLDVGGHGEGEPLGEGPQPVLAARGGGHYLDPVGEVDEALGMRLHRIAEPDDVSADARHALLPVSLTRRVWRAARA